MNIFQVNCSRFYRIVRKGFSCTRLLNPPKTFCSQNKKNLTLGFIPVIPSLRAQSLSDSESNDSYSNKDVNIVESKGDRTTDDKTPWERVKAVFETDEFGNRSRELTATIQCSCMAIFIGSIYGGIDQSRRAFVDFMERNQASIFENHLDAKRRLQNHVTIHFGKGAFKWGWRLGVFTGGFMLIFLSLHAYRGTTRLVDYAASSAIVGATMRLKLGPPGIIIGGAVGGVLGLFCGLVNQTMLSLSGTSYDDILSFQYQIDSDRERLLQESQARGIEAKEESSKVVFETLREHDENAEDIS